MSYLSKLLLANPAVAAGFRRWRGPCIGLFALLCVLTVALAGFAGSAQSPMPAAEPQSVGPVANLTASAESEDAGAVRLTWSEAENAQVHFVVYAKSEEVTAGSYASARMVPFPGTEGVIRGLEGGASYHFIAIGMRWNWMEYGTVWGSWSAWVSATPEGTTTTSQPAPLAAESNSVGPVANLVASAEGQEAGAVRLTWDEAENAQVHFVVYVKSDELTAGSYSTAQMVPFAGSQGVIGGLEGGTSYHFIAIGMRWNWVDYGTVWGTWSGWTAATPAAGSVDDRAALVALYNATNGPNWENNYNWLSDEPLDHWAGVSIDTEGRVTRLSLSSNRLAGPIPGELGNLSNLDGLSLAGNQLTGPIPGELSSLSNLTILYLSGNRLTGCVPDALQDVRHNDFDDLGLPFCGAANGGQGASGNAPADQTADTIVFGYPNWKSIRLQTRIAQYIVEKGYGYQTDAMDEVTATLISALRRGDVDVLMELWLPRQQEAWSAAQDDGSTLSLGESLSRHWESAFVIPDYLQEQYPDLDSVEDLKLPQYKSLFATATSGGKARLVSCVRGWECEIDNAAQVEGYGLSNHVEIFNPASGPALDADLHAAYESQEPWLGFQWATSGPALQLDLVRLSEPPYSDECWSTTKACAYEDATILIASSSDLPSSAPDVAAMLRRWDFDIDAVYKDIARWRFENPSADIDAAALWWLNNRSSIWNQWVTDGAAASIRTALSAGEVPEGWQ